MKYEKSIFELMIDQKFPLVNFDFDWFWPKWPFFPFWSIEALLFKIGLQSFNHRCSISYKSPWNQIWIKKLKNSWLNSNPSFTQLCRRKLIKLQNPNSSGNFERCLEQRWTIWLGGDNAPRNWLEKALNYTKGQNPNLLKWEA